ncbi:MAG: hypothetical protein NVS3B17_09720 [Vulcanimicrobiaceae bacterium]
MVVFFAVDLAVVFFAAVFFAAVFPAARFAADLFAVVLDAGAFFAVALFAVVFFAVVFFAAVFFAVVFVAVRFAVEDFAVVFLPADFLAADVALDLRVVLVPVVVGSPARVFRRVVAIALRLPFVRLAIAVTRCFSVGTFVRPFRDRRVRTVLPRSDAPKRRPSGTGSHGVPSLLRRRSPWIHSSCVVAGTASRRISQAVVMRARARAAERRTISSKPNFMRNVKRIASYTVATRSPVTVTLPEASVSGAGFRAWHYERSPMIVVLA